MYPFAVYFLKDSSFHLPAMLLSYFMMGLIPIAAAVIPSEAVPIHLKAKAIGLITAVGEIIGGVLIPALAGGLSDAIHPASFLWVAAGLALISFLSAFKLEEDPTP